MLPRNICLPSAAMLIVVALAASIFSWSCAASAGVEAGGAEPGAAAEGVAGSCEIAGAEWAEGAAAAGVVIEGAPGSPPRGGPVKSGRASVLGEFGLGDVELDDVEFGPGAAPGAEGDVAIRSAACGVCDPYRRHPSQPTPPRIITAARTPIRSIQ